MDIKVGLRLLQVALLVLAGMASAVFAGDVIYVDIDAPGTDNGSSWSDAYTSLQDALSAAVPGQEIRVAATSPTRYT